MKTIFFKRSDISKNEKLLTNSFKKNGVIVIENFFRNNDKLFNNYKKDLNILLKELRKKKKISERSLLELRKEHPTIIGFLCKLGSKPNNFISGLQLKCHPEILKVCKKLLKTKLLGTMNSSDRLFFESNLSYEKKFFQDIHNDYNYVWQTKSALTASLNLFGEKNSGGIEVYLKSHEHDFAFKTDKHKRPQLLDEELKKLNKNFEKIFIPHNPGSITFFHTLLYHCTIQTNSKKLRVVQIFRYSDLKKVET